jgi:hypothetical protein
VGVIDDLADRLTSAVWNTIANDDMDAAAEATIDATLTEFHSLVMKVATVLIDADAASDAAEEGQEPAMKAQSPRHPDQILDATAAELASVKESPGRPQRHIIRARSRASSHQRVTSTKALAAAQSPCLTPKLRHRRLPPARATRSPLSSIPP